MSLRALIQGALQYWAFHYASFFFPCVRIRIHLCLTFSVLYVSKADPRLNTKLSEDMVVHFRTEKNIVPDCVWLWQSSIGLFMPSSSKVGSLQMCSHCQSCIIEGLTVLKTSLLFFIRESVGTDSFFSYFSNTLDTGSWGFCMIACIEVSGYFSCWYRERKTVNTNKKQSSEMVLYI